MQGVFRDRRPRSDLAGVSLPAVAQEAVRETAAVFGTRAVELPRVAHDLMLDVRWESAAQALEAWLETLEK